MEKSKTTKHPKIKHETSKDNKYNFIVIVENEPSELAIENFNKTYRKIYDKKLSSSSSTQKEK